MKAALRLLIRLCTLLFSKEVKTRYLKVIYGDFNKYTISKIFNETKSVVGYYHFKAFWSSEFVSY